MLHGNNLVYDNFKLSKSKHSIVLPTTDMVMMMHDAITASLANFEC